MILAILEKTITNFSDSGKVIIIRNILHESFIHREKTVVISCYLRMYIDPISINKFLYIVL